jgi:hypothetical protein
MSIPNLPPVLTNVPPISTSETTVLPGLPPVPTKITTVLPGVTAVPIIPPPVPNINNNSYITFKKPKDTSYKSIYSIFHSIIAFFAIYLSIKCNNGFSFGGFFMALFFPYFYIIYKVAMNNKDSKCFESY